MICFASELFVQTVILPTIKLLFFFFKHKHHSLKPTESPFDHNQKTRKRTTKTNLSNQIKSNQNKTHTIQLNTTHTQLTKQNIQYIQNQTKPN